MKVQELLKGIAPEMIVAREDNSVFTLHNTDGDTVAEVVVGKNATRANFKAAPDSKLGITTAGRAKNWGGGGLRVTAENATSVRKAIDAAMKAPTPVAAAS